MRFWITQIFLLLISANVVYGTHGDIYADKVQELINPIDTHISYTPEINTDLFIATKCKEKGRADELFSKSVRNLQEWSLFVFSSFEYNNTVLFTSNRDESAYIPYQIVRKLIFPHHFFS